MSASSAPLSAWPLRLASFNATSAWAFKLSAALSVGGVVALVMIGLDDAPLRTGLLAGALAVVPAWVAAVLALHLARTLAHSSAQREAMAFDGDDATNVYTQRQFMRLADREWSRCRRYGDHGAMLLIETDHLERIQHNLGQRAADAVQTEITGRVNATLRQSDMPAHFAAGQLAIFLAHTDPLGALDAAERIRQQVAGTPFIWEDAAVVATVSVGVAHVHLGQIAVEGLLGDAEAALAAAKEAGRNCVRATPIHPQSTPRSITT